jgi:D-apiose dehydrogenase
MISEFHLRGWNRIPEVEMVALCNRTVSRAEQRAREFAPRARIYSDFKELLRCEDLDFVDILTAPAGHREHCLMARDADVHVICQKPLCDDLDAARSLVREMATSKRLFAVHENHRYRPWFSPLVGMASQGAFGSLRFLEIGHLNATSPAEAYKTASTSGVLLEYGSHLVDMMRALLGEPQRVYARAGRLNDEIAGESLVHAVFEYQEASAIVQAGWKAAALTQGGVLIAGTSGEAWYEGTLTRGQGGRLRVTALGEVKTDVPVDPTEAYIESFYLFQRECVDAMLGRGVIVQTGAENLRTLECTFAAYESIRRGVPIEIPQMTGH